MSSEEAEHLSLLVKRCLEGGAAAQDEGKARDEICFEITIEGEGLPRRFSFSDRGVPPSAKELLEYLSERAAAQPP